MVSAVLLPNAKAAFIAASGAPAVGYKVKTYDAGTLTPRPTYLDAAGVGSNTNPIILDARGEAVIYWSGSYKVILTDPNDVVIWTADNFSPSSILAGPVGIDMTPVNELDIDKSTANAPAVAQLQNTNVGNAATAVWRLRNSTPSTASFTLNGGSFTTAGVLRQDGAVISCSGAGGLTLNTSVAQPIYFAMNGTETGRFTTNRAFKATTDGTYIDATGERHEFTQHFPGDYVVVAQNKNAATPFGIQVNFSAAAPNGTGNEFLVCTDGTTRATLRSNGGLANFSANNVNLSDISVKPEFQKHTTADLIALEASFVAVDWGKFKYADQTHGDWNYGYSAQGVEAAFALTVPAMTDVWNPTTAVEVDDGTGKMVQSIVATPAKDQLRAVYTEDLHNIAHALLAHALVKIAALEARLAAAGIP